MAVTYSTAVKTARMQAVADQIDAGAAGKLKLYTAADALLVTLTLADPCGTAAAGALTLDFDPDITAAASGSGTATKAELTTSADVVCVSGLTVGTAATDIILDNNVIASGQNVTITTGVITHA